MRRTRRLLRATRAADLRRRARRALEAGGGLTVTRSVTLVSSPRRSVLDVAVDGGEPGGEHRYIAKAAPRGALAEEVRIHRRMEALGLPLARLVLFIEGAVEVMVLEHLEGPSVADSDDDGAWRLAGETAQRLHRVDPAAIGLQVFDGAGWLQVMAAETRAATTQRLIPRSRADALGRAFRELAPVVAARGPKVPAHGDLMPKHMVLDAGVLHVIDVERAIVHDPGWDLAVLSAFHLDRLDDILAGYAAEPSEEQRLRQVIPAYQLERLIRAVNWNARNQYAIEPCATALAHRLASL